MICAGCMKKNDFLWNYAKKYTGNLEFFYSVYIYIYIIMNNFFGSDIYIYINVHITYI